MNGELTLDMLTATTPHISIVGETTRPFERLKRRHVAELLVAARAAAFFTRPEPEIAPDPGSTLWRVRIAYRNHSRELDIPHLDAPPELERVARAARACLRDRQVISFDTISDEERAEFIAALKAAPTR